MVKLRKNRRILLRSGLAAACFLFVSAVSLGLMNLARGYRETARLSRMESETLEDRGDPILRRYGRSTLLQNAAYADALAALTAGDEAAATAAYDRYCRIIREREAVYPMDFDVYRAIEVTQRYTGLKETPCTPTNDEPTTERDERV